MRCEIFMTGSTEIIDLDGICFAFWREGSLDNKIGRFQVSVNYSLAVRQGKALADLGK